ncbi:MAG: FKBP-type peptidyl-prolyl cis-trans isomerase [Chitinophagaceae bacterium]|nr:FKBP-type peptidyl-prolyl cis-trans isomerase [Chitinophagaceae bacterium]
MNYTGKTLAGKVFDSNTDPQFQHVDPLVVNMKGGVIRGWTDGLTLLKKGAKARFYIPSPLAYGAQGAGADIKPNEILIFDINVIDIVSQEEAMLQADKERMQMEAMQKQINEMQKAQADTSNKKK